ncbi:hypothetical protein NDU88_009285 [Pleurodeles waltl]|uniref:Uncharacterized protein n=1 Tax=Pleurodeles waltl TaxID=8319 RepID=A0AAV7PRP5_PLEWA|nr:hypothetical protein NDU88_009285 [Pleurodeles waltl]
MQTRQLLQAARAHSPFRSDDLEVRLTTDFSKETSDRRGAFLALRPPQLDVKYGLFEPARITKEDNLYWSSILNRRSDVIQAYATFQERIDIPAITHLDCSVSLLS